MVGTYSPPHLRHHEHFEAALNSGQIDFVLVIPNDFTVHKPFAIETETRLKMLQLAYKDHPRIIVPHSIQELGYPLTKKTVSYLNQKFTDIEWIGMMGKDSSLSFWPHLGAFVQGRNRWAILTPDNDDENSLPKQIGRGSAFRIYSPTAQDIRSSEIRKAASNKDKNKLQEYVFPKVASFIIEQDLYSKAEPKPKLRDYLNSCSTFLKKMMFSSKLD